jgi:hypothetical protein
MDIWVRDEKMRAMLRERWSAERVEPDQIAHLSRSYGGILSTIIAYAPPELQAIHDDLITGKITQAECWDRIKPWHEAKTKKGRGEGA